MNSCVAFKWLLLLLLDAHSGVAVLRLTLLALFRCAYWLSFGELGYAGRRHFVPPITGCGRSFDEVVRPILDLSYYIEAKRQSLIYKATLFTWWHYRFRPIYIIAATVVNRARWRRFLVVRPYIYIYNNSVATEDAIYLLAVQIYLYCCRSFT